MALWRATAGVSVLYRNCRTLVGEGEPIGELLDRLLGCRAIERHQRGRAAWDTDEVSTPAFRIDEHRFDLVHAPVDGLFDAVDGHEFRARSERVMGVKTRRILVTWWVPLKAKGSAKARPQHRRPRLRCMGARSKKKCGTPAIHSAYTVRPHFFHSAPRQRDGCV